MKRLLSPGTSPAGLTLGPIETKVAASGITGAAVTLVLQILAAYVPGFHPPDAGTTALIVTVLGAVAGWFAPHTPRPAPPPEVTVTVPSLSADEVTVLKNVLSRSALPQPSARRKPPQPAATPDAGTTP
jgi:hypothetical protein